MNRLITKVYTNAKPAPEEESAKWIESAEKINEDMTDEIFGPMPMLKRDEFLKNLKDNGKFLFNSEGLRKKIEEAIASQ